MTHHGGVSHLFCQRMPFMLSKEALLKEEARQKRAKERGKKRAKK
jgi:hypothetical protein